MPLNPTMSTEIVGLSFKVYYETRALTDKEKDFTTKDIQKQPYVIYQVKVESHDGLEDESVRTVVVIKSIPIFWQLHNSDLTCDLINKSTLQHTFYNHKRIAFFSNSNESKKIIELLPLFVLTNNMQFFKNNYVRKIYSWLCFGVKQEGYRRTIRHSDNELLAGIYENSISHRKKVDNEKAPNLRNVLSKLKNQDKYLENCQASSYSVFNEVVTKLKGLDIHLKEMKDWCLHGSGLREGVEKIYAFHKEFIRDGDKYLTLVRASESEEVFLFAYKRAYKNFKKFCKFIVDSYNTYLRRETDKHLEYYCL
ncbi:hypothetical protein CDIK_2289 [Cucumispora dikerogammari]|nr:hypothetical protein CDIK_2289 [Cucumispora dikerogammari]